MNIADLFPIISFVLISVFTPGPSNISSASMGVLYGYKNSLKYLLGLAAGFFFVMMLSGWISTLFLSTLPAIEPALRLVGAVYILYLAFGMLKASYTFNSENVKPMGFKHGLMLQVSNPKLILFAITLFSAFLAPVPREGSAFVLAVTLLTLTAFCATFVWALFGSVIKTYLHFPRVKAAVNIILALFLVYAAVELAGIL
jgi:cysteine/O-acetylserine efflux protein